LLSTQIGISGSLALKAKFHPPYGGFTPQTPVALALSPADFFYLLDQGSATVSRFNLDGVLLNQYGGPGSGNNQFSDPTDVSASNGLDIFVSDRGNDRIVRLNRELHFLAAFSSLEGTTSETTFERPLSVAIGRQGDLFIADGSEDRILKLDSGGNPIFSFGDFGESRGSLSEPRRLELDSKIGLWTLDGGGQVVHFDDYGSYLESIHIETAGKRGGLAVSPTAIWICTDSLLYEYVPSERHLQSRNVTDLALPPETLLIDLAYRNDCLWILTANGAVYCYQLTDSR
jgi:hypothetical protein